MLSARLVPTGVTGGVEAVSVFAVDVADIGDIGQIGAGRWPADFDYPEASVEPVGGHRVVPAHADVQLLFVIDVRDAGRWEWAGVQIEYVYSGLPYSAFAAVKFVVCADLAPNCRTLLR